MTTPHDGSAVPDKDVVISFGGYTGGPNEAIEVDVRLPGTTRWDRLLQTETSRRRFIRWSDVDWHRWSSGSEIPDRYWAAVGTSGFAAEVRATNTSGSSDAELEVFDRNIFGTGGCWSFGGQLTDLQECVADGSPVATIVTEDLVCGSIDAICDQRDEDCDGVFDEDAGTCPRCSRWGAVTAGDDCCPGLVSLGGVCRSCTDVLDEGLCSEGWVTTFRGGQTDRFVVPDTDATPVSDRVAGGALRDTSPRVDRVEYRLTRDQRLYTFEENLEEGVDSGGYSSFPLAIQDPGYLGVAFTPPVGGAPQESLRVIDGGECSITLPWPLLAQFLAASLNQFYATQFGREAALREFLNGVEHIETTITPRFESIPGGVGAPQRTNDSFTLRSRHRITASEIRCARDAIVRVRADIKLALVPGLNPFGQRIRREFESAGCRFLRPGANACENELSCDLYEGSAPMIGPDGQTYEVPFLRPDVIVRPGQIRGTGGNAAVCRLAEDTLLNQVGCSAESDQSWTCVGLRPDGDRLTYFTDSAAALPSVEGANDIVFERFDLSVNPDPDNAACNIFEFIADKILAGEVKNVLGQAEGALNQFLRTQVFERRASALGVPRGELRECTGFRDPVCYSGAYTTPSGFVVGARDRCDGSRCGILRIEPRRINLSPEGLELVLAESPSDPQATLVTNYGFGSGGIAISDFCRSDRFPNVPANADPMSDLLDPASSTQGLSATLGDWGAPTNILAQGLHRMRGPREICDPRTTEHCDGICQQSGFACSVDVALGTGGGVCSAGLCCDDDEIGCRLPGRLGFCANLLTDDANCGECGVSCVPGASCQEGSCVCEAPRQLCPSGEDDVCVDPSLDREHCGGCGIACAEDASCDGGLCCGAGEANCTGESCNNLLRDPNHCGACGRRCGAGQPCVGGVCVPL